HTHHSGEHDPLEVYTVPLVELRHVCHSLPDVPEVAQLPSTCRSFLKLLRGGDLSELDQCCAEPLGRLGPRERHREGQCGIDREQADATCLRVDGDIHVTIKRRLPRLEVIPFESPVPVSFQLLSIGLDESLGCSLIYPQSSGQLPLWDLIPRELDLTKNVLEERLTLGLFQVLYHLFTRILR